MPLDTGLVRYCVAVRISNGTVLIQVSKPIIDTLGTSLLPVLLYGTRGR